MFSRKRILFIGLIVPVIIMIVFVMTSCLKAKVTPATNDAINKLPSSTVAFRLDYILERPGVREFDIYLERPDLGLKQPPQQDGVYTKDLPLALQPKLMYVSEVTNRKRDSGLMANRPSFPHRCTIKITPGEQAKTVLVKIVFGDNTYAEKEITIPSIGKLDEPIILEPKSAPKDGDKFQISFNDVDATAYTVDMRICHPYRNDGINPCLKGVEYILIRNLGNLIWQKMNYEDIHAAPTITVKNGIVEVSSPLQYDFAKDDESVRYLIKAIATGMTNDGVKTYIESKYEIEYTLHR